MGMAHCLMASNRLYEQAAKIMKKKRLFKSVALASDQTPNFGIVAVWADEPDFVVNVKILFNSKVNDFSLEQNRYAFFYLDSIQAVVLSTKLHAVTEQINCLIELAKKNLIDDSVYLNAEADSDRDQIDY